MGVASNFVADTLQKLLLTGGNKARNFFSYLGKVISRMELSLYSRNVYSFEEIKTNFI